MTGQEHTASGCARGGCQEQFLHSRVAEHWKRLPRAGVESPPWHCSDKEQMWHFVMRFGGPGVCSKVGLDPGGCFQP